MQKRILNRLYLDKQAGFRMNKYLLKMLLAAVIVGISPIGFSEDIDLYISDVVRQAGNSTKVLIIFDTSGSMDGLHTVSNPFDPNPLVTYPAIDSAHSYNDAALYFNKGGVDNSTSIPADNNDARRFREIINSCETSKAILEQEGFYTGRIREYTYSGQTGSWNELRDNNGFSGIEIIDCEDDAYIVDSAGNVINTGSRVNATDFDPGYPVNEQGTKTNPISHDNSVTPTSTNVNWTSGGFVTLYTAKYLRWYHGQNVGTTSKTRMATAIESMTSVINTTPSVEFGLEVFNYNNWGDDAASGNGGRIALGIKEMTVDNKANLINIINTQLAPQGGTPLCESVYEASQYFSGAGVEYGDDDITIPSVYTKNLPPMDPGVIEVNAVGVDTYKTPFSNCSSSIANIILITDGVPQTDNAADSLIRGLTTKVQLLDGDVPVYDSAGEPVYVDKLFTGNSYPSGNGSNDESYLPALAGWMSEYDINTNLEGKQTVVTHTIGFSEGADAASGLLLETARQGKGEYFSAHSGLELTQALINIINKLPQSNDSLTSASVAANNFDRTQTLDSVYYAMFEPQNGARWQGNLKKYKVIDGEITGVGGGVASCDVNGRSTFCEAAQSYWSSEVDGNIVGKGGVVGWFNSKAPTDRKLYMDASASSLVDFNRANLDNAFPVNLTGAPDLADKLGVAGLVDSGGVSLESAAINEMIAWAIGADVDDDDNDTSFTDMRADVFGDPLHSKPVVVNYGSSIRIVIGTNSGALHMFKDLGDTVEESWAFMPKEFIDNIKILRENYSTSNKIYGIDGEITVFQNDTNGDGTINGSDGDTAWLFFGLRRGGSSYYAINITDPDTPELMWHIDSSSPGFSELGQSWSQPKVGYSKLNTTGDIASPVVFIGGGYDIKKDSVGVASPDDKGRGIYMLDARTGNILWSTLPVGGTTSFLGNDSIASPIGLLDSTGNGLVDRLYAGDTGGNIWRVDMPGAITSEFSVFKLASLGGGVNDQRFFYEPTIVRTFISEILETTVTDTSGATTTMTVHQETPYDAILIGSGDRTTPLGKDTTDTLYMIKDSNILTQKFPSSTTPLIPVPTTIDIAGSLDPKAGLYNYTDNPFSQTMTTQEEETLLFNVSQKSGWYINLLQSGEKATAAALVINGIAHFTTYTPASTATVIDCKPPEGAGWLYAVDLALGIKMHNSTKDVRPDDTRAIKIGTSFLDTPTIVVLPDPEDPTKEKSYIFTDKEGEDTDTIYTTKRIYIHSTENQ